MNEEKLKLLAEAVKQRRDLYLLKGIEISCERNGETVWTMKSGNPHFRTYQAAVPFTDAAKLEKNTEKFKKRYPALLKGEIERMIEAYPNEEKYREDYKVCLRLFDGMFR